MIQRLAFGTGKHKDNTFSHVSEVIDKENDMIGRDGEENCPRTKMIHGDFGLVTVGERGRGNFVCVLACVCLCGPSAGWVGGVEKGGTNHVCVSTARLISAGKHDYVSLHCIDLICELTSKLKLNAGDQSNSS